MASKNNHILSLIDKFQNGSATIQELQELELWYQSFNNEEKYTTKLTAVEKEIQKQKMLSKIDQKIDSHYTLPKKINRSLIISIAASVIILFGLGIYFNLNQQSTTTNKNTLSTKTDVNPGGNKATLTLSNGEKIVLEDKPTGNLAEEGNVRIIKLESGMLAYQTNGTATPSENLMNTISTPIGGQFKIILADGTKVWLNAASSITFPSKFNKAERVIKTTGETYFEVAQIFDGKNKIPFRVISETQKIEVLGTHFNINAYQNENALKSTLVEGSIRITNLKSGKESLLKAGQQAIILPNNDNISISDADTEQAIAWKNGLFKFDNTDLITLMKQLERWYPIDVVYHGNIRNDKFFGKIERSYTLSEVLKVLELGNIHFKIDSKINKNGNRNLIVMP